MKKLKTTQYNSSDEKYYFLWELMLSKAAHCSTFFSPSIFNWKDYPFRIENVSIWNGIHVKYSGNQNDKCFFFKQFYSTEWMQQRAMFEGRIGQH